MDSKGTIYGHLVSGDLDRGIGHIIPAAQTFQEMKSQGNLDITLPRPPLTSDASVSSAANIHMSSSDSDDGVDGPVSGASARRSIHAAQPESQGIVIPDPAVLQNIELGAGPKWRLKGTPTAGIFKRPAIPQALRRKTKQRRIVRPSHVGFDSPHDPSHQVKASQCQCIVAITNLHRYPQRT